MVNTLKKEKAGDIIELELKNDVIQGILLPEQHPDFIFLKLDSGYNIGISKKEIINTKVKGKIKLEEFPEAKIKSDKTFTVTLIAVGGTITSRIDYTTGAVSTLMKPSQLFTLVPELAEVVNINKVIIPFNVLSEDITSQHWKELANVVMRVNSDAVIITHGTDTLHYTASALSFMLQSINKPVVLTYSQRSADRPSTDAIINLTCSAHFAVYAKNHNMNGIFIVGHATSNDDYCFVLPPTKTRKMHTSRRDTFRPINALPLAKVWPDGKVETVDTLEFEKIKQRNEENTKNKTKNNIAFSNDVALIKFYPNADPSIIDYYASKGYKGIVIEATGFGHVSTEGKSWISSIKKAISKGMIVCFAAQTLYGKLNDKVYSTARKLSDIGVVYLKDMLPETAYTKLGWLLGFEKDKQKVKELMLTNLAGEFRESRYDTFLY